jgi:hypothetical protein
MSWQDTYEYACGIKVTFDKPIVSEVEIASGSETKTYRPPVITASSSYSPQVPQLAIDGDDSTYWRSNNSLPVWLACDFGKNVSLNKLRVVKLSSYRPRGYTLQGSEDGSSWADLKSGEMTNVTGEEIIMFEAASYRYWRLYITSLWSSRCHIGEITFFGDVTVYSSNGFSVTGMQYATSPQGVAELNDFRIRKITKSPDEKSIYVWLWLEDRLKYPVDQINVTYDKSVGNLVGAQSAQVESFSLTFTPTNLTPFFDPHNAENIDVTMTHENELIHIFYEFYQAAGDETITAALTHANKIIHVNDLEN